MLLCSTFCSELIQKYRQKEQKLKETLGQVVALTHCIEGLKGDIQTLHQVSIPPKIHMQLT